MKYIFTLMYVMTLILSGFSQYTSSPDSSAWPTSPDSGLVIGYGVDPQVVSDGDGGAIVAYALGDFSHLKVKRVDKWGWLQWNGWNGVDPGGVGAYQELYNLTEDSSGGCFICFKDAEVINPGTPWEEGNYFVTVNKIDHQGNLLWGNGIRVTALDSVIQGGGEVYPDGQDGCIVSWGENRTITPGHTNNPNVFLQRFDYLGTRCWGDSGLQVTPDSTNDSKGYMMVNEYGETFITWWNGSNYYMQKLNIYGGKVWSVNGLLADQVPWPIGISDRNGGFILAGILSTNGRYRLAAQHIDSNGIRLWGSNGVTLVDSILVYYNESGATGMILDSSNNIFVSYYFAKSGEPDVFLQKLMYDGTKVFGDEGINVSEYPSSKNGGGIIMFRDSLLYAWNDQRGGTYVQKFDIYGNRIWNNDIYFHTRGISHNYFTDDCNGGIIKINAYLDFSLRLSKISKNGNIGEVLLSSIKELKNIMIPKDFVLNQNYPNPFNNSTTISYNLFSTTAIQLTVYDITGKELKRIVKEKQIPGFYQIRLDMSEFSSGLYFYELKTDNQSITRKLLLIK